MKTKFKIIPGVHYVWLRITRKSVKTLLKKLELLHMSWESHYVGDISCASSKLIEEAIFHLGKQERKQLLTANDVDGIRIYKLSKQFVGFSCHIIENVQCCPWLASFKYCNQVLINMQNRYIQISSEWYCSHAIWNNKRFKSINCSTYTYIKYISFQRANFIRISAS